jgi:hypothetical protein
MKCSAASLIFFFLIISLFFIDLHKGGHYVVHCDTEISSICGAQKACTHGFVLSRKHMCMLFFLKCGIVFCIPALKSFSCL